jgi:hypothetical protein
MVIARSNNVLAGDEPASIFSTIPKLCACGFAPEAERWLLTSFPEFRILYDSVIQPAELP